MMTIGEFSQTTGLTIKALRHYDDIQLLTPVEVDPITGYRRYDYAQVKTAATISLLREMGLPLEDIRGYLADETNTQQLLEDHRQQVLTARRHQDRLWDDGRQVLEDYARDYEIGQRTAEALPWIGLVTPISEDPEDFAADQAAFHDVIQDLVHQDIQVTGPLWTEFRIHPDSAMPLMCQAAGISAAVAPTLHRPECIETGTLAPRIEKYIRLAPVFAMSSELSAPHPAVVALFSNVNAHQVQRYRQVRPVTFEDSEMELVVDLPLATDSTAPAH